jgi:hypothetical protein
MPLRFKLLIPLGTHPTRKDRDFIFGCYFPDTDLVVTEMGSRGTGKPTHKDLVWIDNKEDNHHAT